MAKRKRKFTAPLGSGTAPSLGNRDPRARRDRAARSAEIPDPLVTTEDVEALQARIAQLEAATAAAAAEAPTEETTLNFETGDSTFDNGTYFFASFGVDGSWTADRFDGETIDTLTGTGTKPTSLSDFDNLPWPIPAP